MADLRTRVSASLTPEAQTRMDNAGANFNADQAFQSSISSELSRGWTSAGLSEKGNALLDQANNAYRSGDEATGRAIEAEGVRTLEQARIWAPSVQRASDIQDLGGAVKWGMGALASGVRSTLPSSAGAVAGGVIGGLATRSLRGAQIGAGIGAGSAGYNQMANETIGEAMMDPSIRATKGYQEIKDTGRVSGALQAPLEAIVPGVMGGAALGLTKGLGRAGIGRAVAAGMGAGAVTEAGTEFAQDLVGQGAMNSLRDKPITQDLDYRQALDSAAAGAVAGGGMGAAGGAMTGLHARGAGLVDQGKDVAANPGQLLDKGAVLAGDALGKAHNAIDKAKSKLSGSLDEFIASRVIDPDRHALLAPMTEEEANLSGQELVDRFTPKAQAWASKVLQNPSAYDKEDVADATEFGTTNDPFLLQSKLKSRMGAKASSKADEAIANELSPKTKSSRMSAETAEATKKEWDESTRLLAKIWRNQGIDEGIIQAVEGSEDDPIKQNAAVAVMSWVQRGFKDADGEVIVPEQMIRAYGAKRAGKLIKNAYDLAVGQGLVDPNESEVTFKDVQDRVKEMGKGHEADTAMVIENLTPIARNKIVDALSFRDKASAQEHVFDLAKGIRSIVQAKAVGDHFGFLHELFGPKMNDVLDHFQPADAEVSSTRDVVADEKASFDADVAQETGEDLEYDPAINEVEADIDSKTRYVSQSKTNEYFDMHDELHRGRFDEETAKQTDPDTRVSKIGLIDREIEKVEAEQGRTLPPAERFEITKKIVKERLGLAAPSKLPDGAGPEQTKAHRKTVEDYERRVRAAASKLNMQYKAMRVSTEKMAEPRVNFSEGDVDELHLKNLDHRGERATIQRGVLFFDRGGNKTPYATSTASILRRMFSIKDGSKDGTTDDFGGDAANQLGLLKQGVASLMTSGGFGRVGYIKYAGQKPTWIKVKGGRLPSDLTIAVNKADGRPITVRDAETQMAEHLAKKPGSSKGTGLEGSVVTPRGASPETKKALDKLEVEEREGTKWRTVRAQSTKEIAFKLGELLKEKGATMTKDVRADIVNATHRFWDLNKKGVVAPGYTAEKIEGEIDALGLEHGFDITTVNAKVDRNPNEPDDIVPSEAEVERANGSTDEVVHVETTHREDDPGTLGPNGKAINRDARGFINSNNTTMVAANMAGVERHEPAKAEPKEGGTIHKKAAPKRTLQIEDAIAMLRRGVPATMNSLRWMLDNEDASSVDRLIEHLADLSESTPKDITSVDKGLDAVGAERLIARAKEALRRARAIVDQGGVNDAVKSSSNGSPSKVGQGNPEPVRSDSKSTVVTGQAGGAQGDRAVAAEVRRDEGVAGGAAAGDARAGLKPKTSMVMRFKDGTDFAGIKHVMRDEFRSKSTMDLIMSGDRTATTRNTKPDLQVGDIVTMDDGRGTKVDVRITKAPYQIKLFGDERDQRNADKWSQLEGWAPEVFKAYASKGAWQVQYELVEKPADKTSGLKSWLSKAKTADIEKVKASIAKMNTEQLAVLEKAVRDYTLLDEIGFDTDSKGTARLSAIEGAVFEAQDAKGDGVRAGTLIGATKSAPPSAPPAHQVKETAKLNAADLVLAPVSVTEGYAGNLARWAMREEKLYTPGNFPDIKGKVLLVSVPGKGRGFSGIQVLVERATKALESGATVLTDNEGNATRQHNVDGEGVLRKALIDAGYVERDEGLYSSWTKTVVRSSKVSTLADKRAEKLKAKVQGIMNSMSDEDLAVLQNDITNYDWGKGLRIPSVLKDSFDAWMSDYRGSEREEMMAHENRDATIERFLEDVAGDPTNYEPAEVAMALHILSGGRIASASKAKAEGKTLTEASPEVQAAKDHILKTVGPKVGLKFVKAFRDGKSGEHQLNLSGQENVIRIALNGDVLGTAYHESIHEFFDILSAGAATTTRDVLLRAGKNKRLLREVSRKLDGHPEAQAQLSDPEEAVAYIYQFWKAGALKIGPETKTLFEKVSEYFRNVLGLVSDEMRERQDLLNAEKILTAFDQGTYGEETIRAGVMAAINADVERQDAALKAVGEKWTTVVNTAGKLVLPAEQVIEASDNKHLLKVLRAFHQKTGDGMGEKASFFEAVSASKNRFMTRIEGVLAKRDKKDLELARKHLINGTTPTDPVTLSIVLKTREVLEDLYKFAAEKQVARWDDKTHEWVGLQHRKDYFPQVWDVDVLLKNGDAFKTKLIETHQKELQAILDKTGDAGVTIDDVAQAILSRMLNSHGQVELDETTSDLGISPMAAAVNRRALDWLDNEVFDQFKEKDLVKILSSYVSSMVKRAEHTDRFGRGGEVINTAGDEAVLEEIGGSQLVNEATAKLPAAIAEWRDNLERGVKAPKPTLRGVGEVIFAAKKGKDVLTEAREKALKKLGPSLKAVMALEGTLGHDIKQGMRTFNSWMMTYQNFRLLSTSLFASFSDTVGLVLNGGELGDAWDGFVRGIREIKLRWQDDKSQDMAAVRAEQWGTVDAGSTLDALGQTYGSAWMSGTARRWSDSLFKWNGMEAWNRAMRITATNVAERVIREFKEKGFDKNDKAAVARFEELFGRGFKPENIKLDANGELDISDSKNQAAVNRWVNGAILRPNAAQRTVWGSDPHFQMIWHMKQFTYTFQNVILGKVIEQAKLGNYRPAMVMMAGYTPIIIAADAVKEMLIPGDEPPWMKGGLAGLIQHGVDKAGLLGIGQMGYDAMASDYGAGLTGPAISQLLHVPFDDPAKTTLGALPLGNLARRAAYD